MGKGFTGVLFLGFIAFLFFGFYDFGIGETANYPHSAQDEKGRVIERGSLENNEAIISRVIDGDTILIINNEGKEERVRFLMIDTPETVDPDKPPEPYGKEASDFVKEYLRQGDVIRLERYHEKDQYGRTLAYVFVDEINLNKLLVEEGLARVAYVREDSLYIKEFRDAEQRAKEKRKNIWSVDGYVTDKGFNPNVIN